MSRRVGNCIIIETEPDEVCELCGEDAETRPYGPGGKRVCYQCGMKNRDEAIRRCRETLFGYKPKN